MPQGPRSTGRSQEADAERQRLAEARDHDVPWRRWGPYLSERQWGTVREDYSEDGDAWDYFSHDQARSRAYRWGEDGIAGISDDEQRLCFALALWNGTRSDPQGAAVRPDQRRGESRRGREGVLLLPRLDADALLHAVPLQVPAGGLPVRRPRRRRTARGAAPSPSTSCSTPASSTTTATSTCSSSTPRQSPEDIADPDHASTTAVPSRPSSTCCRRSGSATRGRGAATTARPAMRRAWSDGRQRHRRSRIPISATTLPATARAPARCCSPRTRPTRERLFGAPNRTPYVKDGINDYVVHGRRDAVESERDGHQGRGALPR